jgi:hypothetical protein
VNRKVTFCKRDFVTHLHLVKKPVWVTLQNFSQVDSNIAGWLPEAIHNAAQGGFVNAEHACKAVLPDACRVHPELQIWVNVSIQGHGLSRSTFMVFQPLASARELLLLSMYAIAVPNPIAHICQHIVDATRLESS